MTIFIIVTYNNEKQIRKCLESVFLNAKNRSLEIIVIDNASTDDTPAVVNDINDNSKITFIQNRKNTGFATAVNQGLKYAMENFPGADCFFLLNPDAWLEKDCLEKLIARTRQNKKFGLFSPLIINPNTQKPWFSGAKISWPRLRSVHTKYLILNTKYLSGCALLIKKEVIEKIGLFEDRFFLYYEDADFSLRARKAGFELKIVPGAICYHKESQSSNSKTKTYYLVKNGLLFFHKHYPKWALPWFWMVFWLRFFYHKYFSKKRVVTKAMKDFIKDV